LFVLSPDSQRSPPLATASEVLRWAMLSSCANNAWQPFSPSEVSMIEKYSDHAANERTFLAWVRTGIAVIAFGFVVEKFNLFIRTLAEAGKSGSVPWDRFTGSFSHYDGLALIVLGMVIILVALYRFVKTGRMIDDAQSHSAGGIKVELVLAVVLGLIVMSMAAYFAL
jgi:putative membrane protein